MANYCVYSGGNGTSGAVAGSVPTAGEWTNAYQSLSACLTAITEADGDIIFVAHDHSYNYGAAANILPLNAASGIVKFISIDRTNTTTATPTAGAYEGTNGNFAYQASYRGYYYGITFSAGSGANEASANVVAGGNGADIVSVFDNCTFRVNSTAGAYVQVGASSNNNNAYVRYENCKFSFNGSTGQHIRMGAHGTAHVIGATLTGSTNVTTAVKSSNAGQGHLIFSSCDFSTGVTTYLAQTSGDDPPCKLVFINCKAPQSFLVNTSEAPGCAVIEAFSCATTDTVISYYYAEGAGALTSNTSVYLTTGGASFTDQSGSAVNQSLYFASASQATIITPLYGSWFNVFVGSTGSKTFSVKIAYDNATALKDIDCWLEVEYYDSATTPMSKTEVTAPLLSGTNSRDVLATGSNLTDTSEAWSGTSGWTNKKTATLSKTVTVNQIGFARARVCLAKASTTIYVDPQLTVA